jgi:hypothetical protein
MQTECRLQSGAVRSEEVKTVRQQVMGLLNPTQLIDKIAFPGQAGPKDDLVRIG